MDNMQLRHAPVIVEQFRGRSYPFATVEQAGAVVRQRIPDAAPDGILLKLNEDIWISRGAVPLHTDDTKRGYRMFGVILINDANVMLAADNMVFDAPVGTMFHLKGYRRHGTMARNQRSQEPFAFLAWDVPRETLVQKLIDDVVTHLGRFARDAR